MRFRFHVQHKLHQTVYKKIEEVDVADFKVPVDSWVAAALGRAAAASSLQPLEISIVSKYRKVLCALANSAEWLRCASISPEELTVESLVDAIRCIDAYVSTLDNSTAAGKSQTSYHLRRLLVDFAKYYEVPRVSRLRVIYRTPHVSRSPGRKMISDWASSGSDVPYPIGATSFNSPSELREKIAAKISGTLGEIKIAAMREINDIEEIYHRYERLFGSSEVSMDIVERLLEGLANRKQPSNAKKFTEWIHSLPINVLAAAYWKISQDALRGELEGLSQFRCLRAPEIIEYIKEKCLRGCRIDLFAEFVGNRIIDQRGMLGCLIILQIHTGWNVNSVLEMDADGIQKNNNGGYFIQGYKSRTAEDTPFVEVLASDSEAIRVIQILLSRLNAMKVLGWVSSSEKRLWLNSRWARTGKSHPFVGWGTLLSMFCKRHGLVQFSSEQLRVEVLASHGIVAGGLEAARHVAGHASINTTAIYLDQLLLQRLNSSYALEFERRLEKSVRYRMGQVQEMNSESDLLYAIGDGTSCADPFNPPEPAFIEHGVCSGAGCHRGEGCSHRRILIDRTRMEEAFRTKRFYDECWRDLLSANKEYFLKIHIPAMLVNTALIGIIENGAYRHIAKAVRKEVYEGR